MTSPISSSKSHKNVIAQLAWDDIILTYFSQGRRKGIFYSIAVTCLGVETSEIHSCLGNQVLPTPSALSYTAVNGALSLHSGPLRFKPVSVGVIYKISLGVLSLRWNGLKNCCAGSNYELLSPWSLYNSLGSRGRMRTNHESLSSCYLPDSQIS